MNPNSVKEILEEVINLITNKPSDYLFHPEKEFVRNRKLSLKTVIEMLLKMEGSSLTKELLKWFDYGPDTVSVSAFVQQKRKIKYEAFKCIFEELTHRCDQDARFNGYRLIAVDGSDLRLPTNKNDSFSFIRNDNESKGYNLLHLDTLYDLNQHIYIDASIQSKIGMNEHKALVSMVDRSMISGKTILVADRGYESFNNIAHCQEKGWNYIIRSKESYGIKFVTPDNDTFDFDTLITLTRRQTKETKVLIQKDPNRYRWIQPHTTFDYIQPRDNTLYDIPLRIVRFKISDEQSETILTNLPRNEFPTELIKELYKMRWHIETSFKELKYNIGLASLHSRKTNMIFQEIYAKLTMYNISAIIAYSQKIPHNKRINFAKASIACRSFISGNISEDVLIRMLQKFISPIRPGRCFPRNISTKNPVSFAYRIS